MTEVTFIQKFDSVYQDARKLQIKHNETEYRCIGSGNCCSHIGLRLHLSECENIADNIKRELILIHEHSGREAAMEWYNAIVAKLFERMFDTEWEPTGKTDKPCAFLSEADRCSIYEYRPLVCRAYSVFMPEDSTCPRKKQPDNSVYILGGEAVDKLIEDFEVRLAEWSMAHPGYDFSIYYATGILRYLLKTEEMEKLSQVTDNKFWQGAPGYPHRFREESWVEE